MKLNEYQNRAMTTCMDTCDNLSYMILNLIGEMGEFSSKLAKAIRKGWISIVDNKIVFSDDPEFKKEKFLVELEKEAGDMLWQLSGLCATFNWHLDDVANQNIQKLAERKKRNTIDGNGDNR